MGPRVGAEGSLTGTKFEPGQSARLRLRLSSERGYGLVELIGALAITVFVVGAVAVFIESGMRAHVDQSRRLEAQQDARLALVRMRKELHCANAVSATPLVAVISLTALIPAECLGGSGADVSVQYTTASAGSGKWNLNRVQAGVTTRLAQRLTTSAPFVYTPASTASRAKLDVDLPVDVDLAGSEGSWRLKDTIVLRNTVRQ
jgi:hypothetical protein